MFSPLHTDRITEIAQRQYSLEIHGGAAFAALHLVGRDRTARLRLPSNGSVTIAGQRYRVSSFREMAWNHEPVTVSILMKG